VEDSLKVKFLDKQVIDRFLKISAGIGAALSTLLLFIDIPDNYKFIALFLFLFLLFLLYGGIWIWANKLQTVNIKIDGTAVTIKSGNIFEEPGLKAIAFNEYFDTQVDNRIISENSLNGIFLNTYFKGKISDLDYEIDNFLFDEQDIIEREAVRQSGKTIKFRLGTTFLKDDYILTAMSKFDGSNRAYLTMPQYLEFLINFWDNVNKIYAQRSVVAPVFGSGITRIQGHKNISDEDLLKIMLWTFRISEMRFKYPAQLTIVIHSKKIDQVNLLDIESLKNGV